MIFDQPNTLPTPSRRIFYDDDIDPDALDAEFKAEQQRREANGYQDARPPDVIEPDNYAPDALDAEFKAEQKRKAAAGYLEAPPPDVMESPEDILRLEVEEAEYRKSILCADILAQCQALLDSDEALVGSRPFENVQTAKEGESIKDSNDEEKPIPAVPPSNMAKDIMPSAAFLSQNANGNQVRGAPASIVSDTKHDSPYDAAAWIINHVHVVYATGLLYFYDGVCYLPYRRNDAMARIFDCCRFSVKQCGTRFVRQVYETLVMEPRIRRNEELLSNVVALDDVLWNLDTGQIYPHTPNVFVTTRLRASYGVGYQAACPIFDQFLFEASCGDTVLIERIWECIAYLLSPKQARTFVLFQGLLASGKSILGKFIEQCFVGDVLSELDINDLAGNFVLSDLVGKKLCTDFDLPADPFTKKAVARLKKLTGGDQVSSDVKFADRVRFINTAKFLFATNHAVTLSNKDAAFNDRLVVVPFARSVDHAHRDHCLAQKLALERDAIICRALGHYYRRLSLNNFQFTGYYPPNLTVSDEGENPLDMIAVFIKNRCEIVEGAWTPTEVLYTEFTSIYGSVCEKQVFSTHFLSLCRTQNLPVCKKRCRGLSSSNPINGFTNIKFKEA